MGNCYGEKIQDLKEVIPEIGNLECHCFHHTKETNLTNHQQKKDIYKQQVERLQEMLNDKRGPVLGTESLGVEVTVIHSCYLLPSDIRYDNENWQMKVMVSSPC